MLQFVVAVEREINDDSDTTKQLAAISTLPVLVRFMSNGLLNEETLTLVEAVIHVTKLFNNQQSILTCISTLASVAESASNTVLLSIQQTLVDYLEMCFRSSNLEVR